MDQHRPGNPFRESARVLGIYFRGQLVIALIVTGLYAAGWEIARMPWWPAMALLCGALHLVPKIGWLIALFAALLVTWASQPASWQLITVLGVWIVVQALDAFVLTPRILGRPLGLRAWMVFVAVLIGGFAFGPIGLVLAVPALAVAAVFWRHFRRRGSS